jgi:steroid delta-isomerase-like uncharacterized protein
MRDATIDLTRQKQLVEEHYAAFWSDASDETLAAQLAPDFVDHAMPPGTPPGPGPVLAWRKAMRAAFPDMKVTVADAVAEGDRVAVRAVWRGTHRGPFQGLAATGRIVAFEGMVFWRLKTGRLAERWAVIDLAAVLRQLQS